MQIMNRAAGPRFVNILGGGQKTILPGEVAEVELAVPLDKDRVTAAMFKSGELVDVAKEKMAAPGGFDPEQYAKDMAELAQLRARLGDMEVRRTGLELDQERRTVPRQFGSDGGPLQAQTVDGTGGALTRTQEEEGRQEPATQVGGPTVFVHSTGDAKDEKAAAEREKMAAQRAEGSGGDAQLRADAGSRAAREAVQQDPKAALAGGIPTGEGESEGEERPRRGRRPADRE